MHSGARPWGYGCRVLQLSNDRVKQGRVFVEKALPCTLLINPDHVVGVLEECVAELGHGRTLRRR